MMKTENRWAVGMAAAGVLMAGLLCGTPVAHADPAGTGGGASIESGSGPRDVGAKIDDGSGTPGPSYDTPISIPSVGSKPEKPGPGATPAEVQAYDKAVKAYEQRVWDRKVAEGAERARQIAKAYSECVAAGRELC